MAREIRYKLTQRADYFAGFIQELAKKEGVKFSLEYEENDLIFTVFEDDFIVREDLFYKINSLVSQTMYLEEIVEEDVEKEVIEKRIQVEETDVVEICPQCIKLLFNEDADEYLDTSLKCSHYLDFIREEGELLDPHLAKLEIEDFGSFETEKLIIQKEPTKNILLLNPYVAEDLFLMTEEEKNRLMSLEKPVLELKVLDDELKELVGESCSVRLFFDFFTASLAFVYKNHKNYIFYV